MSREPTNACGGRVTPNTRLQQTKTLKNALVRHAPATTLYLSLVWAARSQLVVLAHYLSGYNAT